MIQLNCGKLYVDGTQLPLPGKKVVMAIEFFLANEGRIVSRDELANYVWSDEVLFQGVDDSRIDKLVQRVRECIGKERVQTRITHGYLFTQEPESPIPNGAVISPMAQQALAIFDGLSKAKKYEALRMLKDLRV